MVEGLTVDANNQIRITLRNMSDFTVNRVYFRVECYDRDGNPMVCNTDGESTFFDGSYQLPIDPGLAGLCDTGRIEEADLQALALESLTARLQSLLGGTPEV